MAVQELNPQAADIQALRTELDELLRARQYAAQRERRLNEELRTASGGPEGVRGYAAAQQRPDPELLRQLAQVQTLRDGLGARCLELSERLLAMEDQQRQSAEPEPPAAKRPTGARFGGAYQESPVPQPTVPTVAAAPMTGARFGGAKPAAAKRKPESPASPRDAHPRQVPDVQAAAQSPTTQPPTTQPPAAQPPAPTPQLRTAAELTALSARITSLHQHGSANESAAVAAQAAVMLAPADVARLVAMLRAGGPAGAAAYVARTTAHGAAAQAAGTLAELRRTGLTDEAAELFHALWGYPASALPALLGALESTGLAADGLTLLWEWGSAPPAELAALAALLRDSGRPEDARSLLHQAAGRQIGELAVLALELDQSLALTLISEVSRLRSASDLALFGGGLVHRPALYEMLLAAVTALDESRQRSALAALRSASLPTAPSPRPRSRR
ncbi:hypothetical protein GCM10010193_33530 [Kitasatospora atroaurantiaca]|uniref:Uncharacterized protein n=1 Tax=Kitasatospora atroaurantiaca TaxID=285545 RepID=A0A561ENN7_9ACTN|nr:hypothetical protein [Kitasatospora atroaurantiaca]TWE17210.1 hypothetical protein FB465_2218 [Kitasatospora atroaurantiaca]